MQFDQIINEIKGNPVAGWTGVGVYFAVGILVLWRICRSGTHGIPNLTGVVRGVLTVLFALPIWPVIWLVWILHFRKFSPRAIDLTAYRLPVVDLTDHREDQLRFAPKKLVLEAEIVDSPPAAAPSLSGSHRQKPRAKTQPVSLVVAAKRSEKSATESQSKGNANAAEVVEATITEPPGAKNPNPEGKPVEEKTSDTGSGKGSSLAPHSGTSSKSDSEEKPNGAAPPTPKVERSKVITPPPPASGSSSDKPRKPLAPSWESVALDPRPKEPPSAPPFVKKLERLSPSSEGGGHTFTPPAPFPTPSASGASVGSGEADSSGLSEVGKESVANPDVPEIPIRK